MKELRRWRPLAAEFLGAAFLLTGIVGSGIMASRLTGGDQAMALLCNAMATSAILFVLVTLFAPVSGAHLNPAVTLAAIVAGHLPCRSVVPYALAQLAGAVTGVVGAHAMFGEALVQVSSTVRSGAGQWLAEGVATFGLILTIFGCRAQGSSATGACVSLYIGAAYWFTSSTSFANPAVTLARSLSDTFAGIDPRDAPAFITAQLLGGLAAVAVAAAIWPGVSPDVRPAPHQPPPA